MITKKHIRQYFDKLSEDISTNQDGMSNHIWQQLHEYIVKHYKRLDKGARAYADEIFDQLDGSLKQKIDSLPEGRQKKVLSRKLSIVRGERSPIPILYLDTPVIENIVGHALGQQQAGPLSANFESLYQEVTALIKNGKLIYPEDSFHRETLEIGGTQAWEGLNIIRKLSEGLSFKHSQSIEDFQIFRALRGFIDGNGQVNYRKYWQDAFQKKTVNAIMKKRTSIVFKGMLSIAEKPGTKSQQEHPEPLSTRLRIRYDEAALKDQWQLQQRSTRHLRDLVRLGLKYHSVGQKGQKRSLEGFWSGQKIDLPVSLWNHYGGQPEGLEGLSYFYESEHFRDVPAIKVKQSIWKAFSDHENGLKRVTGPADINIISSVLPYTDIMILGRKMTDVVRDKLEFDRTFDTEIYSTDEHELIMAALKEIDNSD